MKQRNFAVLCLLFMVLAAIFSGCALKIGHGPQQADPPTDVQTTVPTTTAQVTSSSAEDTTTAAGTTVATTESSETTSETTVLTTERSEPATETTVPTEPAVVPPVEDWMLAFTVIGEVGESNWDVDFEMVEEPAGTWTTVEAHYLRANANFMIRQGKVWDLYFGDNEGNVNPYPADRWNYAVEVPGTYYIQLVYNESDKTGMIYLIPAEAATDVSTEGPTEVPTEPNEPLALDGTWCSVRRVGETLVEGDLVFFPDGTGYSGSCVYDNIHYQPFPDAVPDEGGWYLQPMGHPLTYFTYCLQDGKLTLTITGDDFEDYSVPITETYAFEQIDADCFRLDNHYGTYVRADGTSLQELCEILNVEYLVS